MASSITIAVPEVIRDELAARAAVCGRTVEEYVRDELIALASRPSAAVWMARVRARKDALQGQRTAAQCAPHGAPECNSGAGTIAAEDVLGAAAEPRREVG